MNHDFPAEHDSQPIEAMIAGIADLVSQNLPGIRCLILGGSFGRDEGSTILINGVEKPFKDFDFFAVIRNSAVTSAIGIRDTIIRDAYEIIGTEPYSEEEPSPGRFRITLEIIPEGTLAHLPNDISNAELKLASRVVWGEDVRKIIPIDIGSIPAVSGLRAVLNKFIGMMEQWGPWIEQEQEIPSTMAFTIRYHAAKIILDTAAAILLQLHQWVPGYKARLEVIREIERHRPLHLILGSFSDKVVKALEIKRHPDMSLTTSPRTIWKQAAQDLLVYADVLSADILDYSPGGEPDGYKRYYRNAKRGFFFPYAESWFKSRGINPTPTMTNGLVLLYSFFANLRTGRVSTVHPMIRVYAAAWLWIEFHDRSSIPRDIGQWLTTHTGIDTADRSDMRMRIISLYKSMARGKRHKRSLR